MEFVNINDAWDCESIERKLRELEEKSQYNIDYRDEINTKRDILMQRKVKLGCP